MPIISLVATLYRLLVSVGEGAENAGEAALNLVLRAQGRKKIFGAQNAI